MTGQQVSRAGADQNLRGRVRSQLRHLRGGDLAERRARRGKDDPLSGRSPATAVRSAGTTSTAPACPLTIGHLSVGGRHGPERGMTQLHHRGSAAELSPPSLSAFGDATGGIPSGAGSGSRVGQNMPLVFSR